MSDNLTPYEEVMEEATGNAVETLIESIQDSDLDDAGIVRVMRDTIPNLEDAKDEDVVRLYRSEGKTSEAGEEGGSGQAAGETEVTEGQAEPWAPNGYSFSDVDGKDIVLTPEILGFLEKAGVNYRALGADHRKSFSDVVRNASRGHLNSKQTEELQRQVMELTESGGKSSTSVKELQEQLDVYDRLLQAAAAGNGQPFVDAVGRYKQNLGAVDTPKSAAEVAAQGIVDRDAQVKEQEAAMNTYVRPRLEILAKEYEITDMPAFEKWAIAEVEADASITTPEHARFFMENTIYDRLDNLVNDNKTKVEPSIVTPAPVAGESAEITNMRNELAQLKAAGGAPASGGADEGTAAAVSKGIEKMNTNEMWEALRKRD